MFDLSEKVALVTGGSRGIGRAVGVALGRAGARVVVNYQGNEEAAREAVDAIRQTGAEAEARRFDISDASAATEGVEGVAKSYGRLDVLVNNAGIAVDQLLLRLKPEDLERTWQTNVGGTVWCSKAAVRPMMRAKRGRIVNLSSVVGEAGNAGQAAYSASKAALIGLTKTLSREYASRGITVNAVAPGYIDTDMTAELPAEARQAIIDGTPAGRVGSPEEVASAVVYLASDEAAYVTGQVLRVNGGMYV